MKKNGIFLVFQFTNSGTDDVGSIRRRLPDTNTVGKTSRDEADRAEIFEENIFRFTEKAVRGAIENLILGTVLPRTGTLSYKMYYALMRSKSTV